MATKPAPTSQKQDVRPISFVLDDRSGDGLLIHVPLVIRPEDLTMGQPNRVQVHQTLGRGIGGWADDFGEGLPSINIAGHTGWRQPDNTDLDGFGNFEYLKNTVIQEYNDRRQAAIDDGRSPNDVSLLFVDTLNNLSWVVIPMSFQLRRNRTRPLLYQYNIQLQAILTDIEPPVIDEPDLGDVDNGLVALDDTTNKIDTYSEDVGSWVDEALTVANQGLAPFGNLAKQFLNVTTNILNAVTSQIRSVKGLINGVGNNLIGIASDIAQSGINIFRTINSIANLPQNLKAKLYQVQAAYNEAFCILQNSLRRRKVYDDYSDLYGASNCSSTTGGLPPSIYRDANVFDLTSRKQAAYDMTPSGLAGVANLSSSDAVLKPMTLPEINRNIADVVSGYGGVNL